VIPGLYRDTFIEKLRDIQESCRTLTSVYKGGLFHGSFSFGEASCDEGNALEHV